MSNTNNDDLELLLQVEGFFITKKLNVLLEGCQKQSNKIKDLSQINNNTLCLIEKVKKIILIQNNFHDLSKS